MAICPSLYAFTRPARMFGEMAFLKRHLFFWALMLIAALEPASAMTLKEAIRTGAARDPTIAALQQAVARETTNIEIVKDGRRPQISLSGDTASTTGNAGLDLTVSIILYDWGLIASQITAASFERVKVVAELKMAVEDLTLQIAELYLDVEQLDQKIMRTRDYIAFARRIEDLSRQRVSAGLGDNAEIARARLETARAEEKMNQLTSARMITLSQMEFLLGVAVSRPGRAPMLSFIDRFASSAVVIAAVNIAPAYVEAKANVDIAAAGIKAAKASTKPTIRLQASGRQDLTGGRGRTGAIGLSAGVNLNAGTFRGRAVRAAEQDFAAAQQRLLAVERDLQNAARTSVEQIRILAANETSQERQLVQAKEVLTAYEQQFVAGRRQLIDLLTTARDMYDAEVAAIDTFDERKRTEYMAARDLGMLGALLFEAGGRK